MKIGTKSILFGVHQFAFHPWIVALAWWRLYGFPFDPRLWFAFFLHDLGYWGKPNMDGAEGELHVIFGAKVMGRLFGSDWYYLCLYHSRFFAKKNNASYSKLCVADKLAITLTPTWIYLIQGNLSGEISEYMNKHKTVDGKQLTQKEWLRSVKDYCRNWAGEFKNGGVDTWTGSNLDTYAEGKTDEGS